jgi:uncharacterized membrane protein (DUF4010 family)
MADNLLVKLIIATAAGLVIGIERGWSSRGASIGHRSAGMRTFALASLSGGLCMTMPQPWLLLSVLLVIVAALAALAYVLANQPPTDLGLTTELSLVITPLLGALAMTEPLGAIATATVVAALLGFKQQLHATLERMDVTDALTSLQLLIVAAVIIPLLPDESIDPWDSINPRVIGLLVLLLLGISYAGYVAVRLVGMRAGLLLTALLGGLTSSTAVTIAYARMARNNAAGVPLLSAGIALACATAIARIWVVCLVLEPAVASQLGAPLLVLGLVPLAYAGWVARHGSAQASADASVISNPLDLRSAILLSAAIAALSAIVRAVELQLGATMLYPIAALSGVLDMDAITVTLAGRATAGLLPTIAATGILLAAIVNTLTKAGIAASLGGPALGLRCGGMLALAGITAAAIAWLGI